MNTQKILNAAISSNPHDQQGAINDAMIDLGRDLSERELAWIALFY